jgi:hypothetical protein
MASLTLNVTDISAGLGNWSHYLASPYIDAEDSAYIYCATKKGDTNALLFEDTAEDSTIDTVTISTRAKSADGTGDVDMNWSIDDGSSYAGTFAMNNLNTSYETRTTADLSGTFDTWGKINLGAVQFVKANNEVRIDIDHCYMTVNYTESTEAAPLNAIFKSVSISTGNVPKKSSLNMLNAISSFSAIRADNLILKSLLVAKNAIVNFIASQPLQLALVLSLTLKNCLYAFKCITAFPFQVHTLIASKAVYKAIGLPIELGVLLFLSCKSAIYALRTIRRDMTLYLWLFSKNAIFGVRALPSNIWKLVTSLVVKNAIFGFRSIRANLAYFVDDLVFSWDVAVTTIQLVARKAFYNIATLVVSPQFRFVLSASDAIYSFLSGPVLLLRKVPLAIKNAIFVAYTTLAERLVLYISLATRNSVYVWVTQSFSFTSIIHVLKVLNSIFAQRTTSVLTALKAPISLRNAKYRIYTTAKNLPLVIPLQARNVS